MKIEKIIKKLPTGFVDEVGAMKKQQLRDMIIQCETNIRAVELERDSDEKLNGAKELVKDYSGPYRDAMAAQRAKIAYVLHVLEERGELPASE
jgi:hypothetical protein